MLSTRLPQFTYYRLRCAAVPRVLFCDTTLYARRLSFLIFMGKFFDKNIFLKFFFWRHSICIYIYTRWQYFQYLLKKKKLFDLLEEKCLLLLTKSMLMRSIVPEVHSLASWKPASGLISCCNSHLHCRWQEALTFDVLTGTGGPNGTIRSEKKLCPAKLRLGIEACEALKRESNLTRISYADLFQLAGVVAVEFAKGPTVKFRPGRQDPVLPPNYARIMPEPTDGAQMREMFSHLSLSDKEIIVIYGAQLMGSEEISGSKTIWPHKPLIFDNSFFVDLLKHEKEGSLRFKSEVALVNDKDFHEIIEMYAKNEQMFFEDYKILHEKFSQFGYNPNSEGILQSIPNIASSSISPDIGSSGDPLPEDKGSNGDPLLEDIGSSEDTLPEDMGTRMSMNTMTNIKSWWWPSAVGIGICVKIALLLFKAKTA